MTFEEGVLSADFEDLQYAQVERMPGYRLVCCSIGSSDHVISWTELNNAVSAEMFADRRIEDLQFIMQEKGVVVGARDENIISVNLDEENFDPSIEFYAENDNAKIYCIRADSDRPYSFPYQRLLEACSKVVSSASRKKVTLTPRKRDVLVYVWK